MKRSKLEDTSYWPGYVDALVNVVLNILFLVGLMAVGLVSLNIEALGNFKSAKQAQQLQKISEDNLLLASLGTLLAAIPPQVKPVPEAKKPVPAPLALPPPKIAEALPQPKPVVVPEPPVLSVGAPFVLTSTAQEQAFLQTKVGISSSVGLQPIVFYFDALQHQLSPAQANALRQQHAAAPAGTRWALMVTVPDAQERTSRDAFVRMSNVRQLLIGHGVSADRISMRTVLQDRLNFSNARRVFVYPQSRVAAVAN
jgi:hypothetical protein